MDLCTGRVKHFTYQNLWAQNGHVRACLCLATVLKGKHVDPLHASQLAIFALYTENKYNIKSIKLSNYKPESQHFYQKVILKTCKMWIDPQATRWQES